MSSHTWEWLGNTIKDINWLLIDNATQIDEFTKGNINEMNKHFTKNVL